MSQVWIQLSNSSLGPAWCSRPVNSLHTGIGSHTGYSAGVGGSPVTVESHFTSLTTLTLYSKHSPALLATGGPYSTVKVSEQAFWQVICFPELSVSEDDDSLWAKYTCLFTYSNFPIVPKFLLLQVNFKPLLNLVASALVEELKLNWFSVGILLGAVGTFIDVFKLFL